MSFLVDTDTCSAYLKGNGVVFNRFLRYTGQLNVSVITMGELYDWAMRAHASPKRLLSIDGLLKEVTVLDVDLTIARKYGELQAGFRDIGQPAPELDLLIGSTALIHGLTLVTHNVQDFVHIPGQHIVDWLAPRPPQLPLAAPPVPPGTRLTAATTPTRRISRTARMPRARQSPSPPD
jgi:tRNA(fMet)-specific endonuclease VapC